MAQSLNFVFLIALNLNLNGAQFYIKHIKIWLFQKVEKSCNKIVKFEIEKFEHLLCKVGGRKC